MFEVMLSGGNTKPKVESMFIREVPSAELITGDALATAIGLTAGTSQNSDAGWLLFEDTIDGKTKYVSKQSMRTNVSWNSLNDCGAITGTVSVNINGSVYKVRSMHAVKVAPYRGSYTSNDDAETHGSEWNRLMYRMVDKVGVSGEGFKYGEWASYSEDDLDVFKSNNFHICQGETTEGHLLTRGSGGVTYMHSYNGKANLDARLLWRPVLELVE